MGQIPEDQFIEAYSQEVLRWIGIYQDKDLEIVPTAYIKADGSCSCTKGVYCSKPGKHPAVRNWTTTYTSKDKRPEEIRWDDRQGVGIPTGTANALLVVDCDSEEAYCLLLERFPEAAETKIVKSFRGYQFYFRLPEGIVIKGATNVLNHIGIPDVDTRGEGNFVMAPPTAHPKGGRYEWFNEEKVISAHQELLTALNQHELTQTPSNVASPEAKNVAHRVSSALSGYTIEVGERHETFKNMATKYRSLGLNRDEILDLLYVFPYENPEDNLFSEEEIVEIVEWSVEKVSVDEGQRGLLQTLLDLYDFYSHMRFKDKSGGTDRSIMLALIQQALIFGVIRGNEPVVPISQRTLSTRAGIGCRKTLGRSLTRNMEKGRIKKDYPVEGSRSNAYRLLCNGIYTHTDNGGGHVCKPTPDEDNIYIYTYTPISLPGGVEHTTVERLLNEFVDFRWGKDMIGKTDASHLSVLLTHHARTGQKIYTRKEIVDILSAHYGKEERSSSLSRFFNKYTFEEDKEEGLLKKVGRGKYEIPEDIYARKEAYREKTGEYLAAEKQDTRIEEERRQYRLREKLWQAGLYSVFAGERLRLNLLQEDGEYIGDCPEKLRELLIKAIFDGEHVKDEVRKFWPEFTSAFENNLDRLKALEGALDYYEGEIHYAQLSEQAKSNVLWYRHTGDTLGMLRRDISNLEGLVEV